MPEKYESLQKRFHLPSINDLEKEFGLELKSHQTNKIIKEITDTLLNNSKLIESLIFLDSGSSPSSLYEASMLREKEIDVFSLYKELMSTYWKGKKALLSDDKQKADFISKSFTKWKKIKQDLAKIFDLFEKEWPNVAFRQGGETAYHG
jgi:hypothetical protein